MSRNTWIEAAAVVGFLALANSALAQAPRGQGAGQAAPAAAAGRGAADAATRPALLFKEEWKQPPYTGALNDENRRVTQAAVTNPNLELKIYGAQSKEIGVYNHEGRMDLWTGMVNSPVAIMLRDRNNLIDLSGLARLRAMIRTANLHVVHPVLKLADGTLVAGSQTIDTNAEFLSSEVAYGNQRWYKLDPEKLVAMAEVKAPDLTKIDEIGFIDLAPSGGHGSAGYANISTVELYAKATPRAAR